MLTKKYNSVPSAIASYDYTDIAEGTGVQIFEGFNSDTSGTPDYHLTTSSLYSNNVELSGASATFVSLDYDFDLTPFNAPRVIKGTAITNFTLLFFNPAGTDQSACSGSATLSKWDGTTETVLVTANTGVYSLTGGSSIRKLVNFPMVVPQTEFKPGENLRLTIKASSVRSGNGFIVIGADPKNRDGDFIKPSTDTNPPSITKIELHCPFVLDL